MANSPSRNASPSNANDGVTDLRSVPEDQRADLRTALIEQVEYLIDEVEALRTVADTVPEPVRSGRPTDDDLSMKELYGLIAELDRHERAEWIRQAQDEDTPALSPAEATERVRSGDWNDRDLDAVLDAVQDARRDLVAQLTDLDADAWMREVEVDGKTLTLFELVHRFAADDFQRLRDLGYRLHDADLSDRGEAE